MNVERIVVRLVEETGASVVRRMFRERRVLVWDVELLTGERWRFWRQHHAIAFAEAGGCTHAERGSEHHCLACEGFLNDFGEGQ